jgi:CDP-diacylglycerol--serine O-phosphatidyltransferase
MSTVKERYNNRIKPRLQKPLPKGVVPSFFTLMNLFCGFMAIVMISEGKLVNGAWLIVFAGVFDGLDGFMARLTSSSGQFGAELDSLSDVVSFGVAPGLLLYKYGLFSLPQPVGILLAGLPAMCGAIRLARFNVGTHIEKSTVHFQGMPIPIQAGMVVSFYLFFRHVPEWFLFLENGLNQVLIPMVILLSILMVSSVPFDKLPRIVRGEPVDKPRIYWFAGLFMLLLLFHENGLIVAMLAYILRGLITGFRLFWSEFMSGDAQNPAA